MKAVIFEHAGVFGGAVQASGKSIAIAGCKVSAVLSGTRLAMRSDGGEDDYCTVYLDSGQEILVCGTAEMVSNCLGISSEI